MSPASDCTQNTDQLKLVREGTSQDQRLAPALKPLDPAFPLVDERAIEHGIVFAQAYAEYLKYFDLNNTCVGDWQPFFSTDAAVQLALALVQDVDHYRRYTRECLNYLKDNINKSPDDLRDRLNYLFSCCATLAIGIDRLKENLPVGNAYKMSLQNIVKEQLSPAFTRLIAYYKGGESKISGLGAKEAFEKIDDSVVSLSILGRGTVKFSVLKEAELSKDWSNGADWTTYYNGIPADKSAYGTGTIVSDLVNHIATHNLFTSILDQFLKVYARIVGDAKQALEENLTKCDCHEPHYALFLAFLRLVEYARTEMNTLTARHLDFYYREVLGLREKEAKPGQAHLLVELAKQIDSHEFKPGALFKAGKDDLGRDAFFANDRDFVANQAKVAALKTVYRHKNNPNETLTNQNGRLFASPVANSDDGLGAKLMSVDQSWHPFYNKIYQDGKLAEIKMPQAEVGFAIASHYLWMAEGSRTVIVSFNLSMSTEDLNDFKDDVVCLFTGKKGWFEISDFKFKAVGTTLKLEILLTGADPAVVPYSVLKHGYKFASNLPILLVKLRHRDEYAYVHSHFKDVVLKQIDLTVDVTGLKTLAISNDFGPVDISKPFQPFGSQPVNGANFTVGSKEVFQKILTSASLEFDWQNDPSYYISTTPDVALVAPNIGIAHLKFGVWSDPVGNYVFKTSSYPIVTAANATLTESGDFSQDASYSIAFPNGFVRLVLKGDLGFSQYQIDLGNFLAKIEPKPTQHPGAPILGPFANAVSMTYVATQEIRLNQFLKKDYETRTALFFHVAPFGQTEQHPFLNAAQKVFFFPQFGFERDNLIQESEAEFYIGVTGLKPPQNFGLLFQVVDGTADPLSENPQIHWSYLAGDEWISFAENDVEDRTGGLLNSGIVTLAVPRKASDTNTLLPTGMHWIRAAVASETDAVCRLRLVAAQALAATFADKGNDPAFPAKVLQAGTISKLEQPDAATKKITQPFETFGGQGQEAPTAFYTRISERLRHKDRAIALWDYERLILEAFPQIYKVKCLNHTQYEPNEEGTGVYRELAPGHVTVVTIPNQQFLNLRDPLRPYTSLGLLDEIAAFLTKRFSCFVKLHIKNPQYEEVMVTGKVCLYREFDETFYIKELKKAISRFLSPWAFPGGGRPSFGGKLYASVLINFVEDLKYVDYVTDFQLFRDGVAQTEVVEGSTAVSILVSARDHDIAPFKPAAVETPPGEKCTCKK